MNVLTSLSQMWARNPFGSSLRKPAFLFPKSHPIPSHHAADLHYKIALLSFVARLLKRQFNRKKTLLAKNRGRGEAQRYLICSLSTDSA